MDRLGVDSCHWVGSSIGGFVGVRLAASHPDRVRSLSLLVDEVIGITITYPDLYTDVYTFGREALDAGNLQIHSGLKD